MHPKTLFIGILLHLLPRTAAQACTPPGNRSCTLSFGGQIGRVGVNNIQVSWAWAVVYDHACTQLAVVEEPKQGTWITVEALPTGPVALTELRTGEGYTRAGMCYGPYCYTGTFACALDGADWVNCEHAFPCQA